MMLLLLIQKFLQIQGTRLAIIMIKREIRKKFILEKTRTARKSGKNPLQIKSLKQNGRIIFEYRYVEIMSREEMYPCRDSNICQDANRLILVLYERRRLL